MSRVIEVGEVTTFVGTDDVLVTVVPSNLDIVDAVVLGWPSLDAAERDLMALLADVKSRQPPPRLRAVP